MANVCNRTGTAVSEPSSADHRGGHDSRLRPSPGGPKPYQGRLSITDSNLKCSAGVGGPRYAACAKPSSDQIAASELTRWSMSASV